jgi:hypothetical protein
MHSSNLKRLKKILLYINLKFSISLELMFLKQDFFSVFFSISLKLFLAFLGCTPMKILMTPNRESRFEKSSPFLIELMRFVRYTK